LTAHLSTHTSRPHYPFLVRAHYTAESASSPPSTWPSIDLVEAPEAGVSFVRTQDEAKAERRRVFVGDVPLDGSGEGGKRAGRVKFAVRYKIDRYAGWRWVEGVGGICVGEILVGSEGGDGEMGADRALVLAEGWTVEAAAGASGGGKGPEVFEVKSSSEIIPPVEDGTDAYGGEMPGKVLGSFKGCVRWCSLVRLEPYWLGVQHSQSELISYTILIKAPPVAVMNR
jgi:hypothetical protein